MDATLWGPVSTAPTAPDGWSRSTWQVALYTRAADAVHRADDLGVQVKGWPSNRAAERFFTGQTEQRPSEGIVSCLR